jgi:hypothetical protein
MIQRVQAMKSADLEVSLSRQKSLLLLQRLRKTSVELNIQRGRVTADGMWLQLEIRGGKPQVEEAVRLIHPMAPGPVGPKSGQS